jgi:hypothetical protein
MPRLAEAAATARQIQAAPMYGAPEHARTSSTETPSAKGNAALSSARTTGGAAATDGWLERHRKSLPTPQLWWAVPVVGVGALGGYARWLKRRESSGTRQ